MIFKGNKVLVLKKEPSVLTDLEDDKSHYIPVRSLMTHLGEVEIKPILKEYLKYSFASRHKFCGYCGKSTAYDSEDGSYKCNSCSEAFYPPVFPAIIVSVVKDDQILLAHNINFPDNLYSVIAGFVDQNESLEECVAREIYEEVGLKVKNIKYFASQFWGFTSSLMIGFTSEYDSGEILVDGKEIEVASWFSRDNIPAVPGKMSMARTLIDHFLSKAD